MDEGNKFKMKNLIKNQKLANYNWFNLGGPAEVFYKANSINELTGFLKTISSNNKKIHILGAGSNTLFRDGGFEGTVIKLGKNFSYCKLLNDGEIEVGAATLDRKLSDFASSKSLSGFEFLSCIPGSVGGSIMMNSGCYGEDISGIFLSVKTIDYNGKIKIFDKNQIKFFYRGNNLKKNLIILSAVFKGMKVDKDRVISKQNELIIKKKNTQPSRVKTCGSTFKNPLNEKKAWELIKMSGCENLKVGGASISKKHCNFFLNNGDARSSDIERLIFLVQEKVFEKTGKKLELEIKIIGKK